MEIVDDKGEFKEKKDENEIVEDEGTNDVETGIDVQGYEA